MALQRKIREVLELAQEDLDSLGDNVKLQIEKYAMDLTHLVLEAEGKVGQTLPPVSEAAAKREIERLRGELKEKDELIKETRAKLDDWMKLCVPVEKDD